MSKFKFEAPCKTGKGALGKSEIPRNDGMLEYCVSKAEKELLLVQERLAEPQGKEFLAFSLESAGGGRSSNLFQGNTYP